MDDGDYIYIPSFSLNKSKIFPKFYLSDDYNGSKNPVNQHLFDKDVLSFSSKIEIYNAVTNTFVKSFEEKYFIPINIDSNFEMIELFSKKDQDYINSKLNNISKDIYDTISSQLFCEPIVAQIEIVNNRLEIPLGEKQGLRVNQLAVLEDIATDNVTMLSISKLDNNRAILSPLNSNLKIGSFLGKEEDSGVIIMKNYFLFIFIKYFNQGLTICRTFVVHEYSKTSSNNNSNIKTFMKMRITVLIIKLKNDSLSGIYKFYGSNNLNLNVIKSAVVIKISMHL